MMAETRRPGRPKKSATNAQIPATETAATESPDTSASPVGQLEFSSADGLGAMKDIDLVPIPTDLDDLSSFLNLVNMKNNVDVMNFDSATPLQLPAFNQYSGPIKRTQPVLDMHQCLKELSELNVELHAQINKAKPKYGNGKLGTYICIDASSGRDQSGYTFGELALLAIQKYYRIIETVELLRRQSAEDQENSNIADLHNSMGMFDTQLDLFPEVASTGLPSPEPYYDGLYSWKSLEIPRIETALVLVIISCYVQLIDIFSHIFATIQVYLETLKNHETIPPIDAIRFFQMGSFCIWDGRLQGLLFCTVITHYLDRIERVLGLLPDNRRQSNPIEHPLLDRPQYRELLERELEGEGTSGRIGSKRLRDTVDSLRRLLMADPSW